MASIEGLKLRINKYRRLKFANHRRKKLCEENFTIISNNCWGGMIYESYNLIKQSPTIGLFFMASDYIKFISNLKQYISRKLTFINPSDSKYVTELKTLKTFGKFPIAKIDDIEIFFLHYKSEEEARSKWVRRIQRINFDKIIYKFNDQNGCTLADVQNFYKLPYKNKLFFTCKNWNISEKYIKIKQVFNNKYINASNEPFGKSKYINITEYINKI